MMAQAVKALSLPFLGESVVGVMVILPKTYTSTARVRVKPAGQGQPSDVSDAAFNLGQPSLIVSRPYAGELWVTGRSSIPRQLVITHNLWPQARLMVELSYDGGAIWTWMGTHSANGPFQMYDVPGPATGRARFRVRPIHGDSYSDDLFTPAAGESENFRIEDR